MHTSPGELRTMDAYFRAANYLTVGQIYLQANPLLREPLRPEHVKERPVGRWGTSPGLNLVYVHVNRLIREHAANAILLAETGHGGPAVLANLYLEGTYTEVYPEVTQDAPGMHRLFCRFSTSGGVPSHVGPTTPRSIHEGGELGYVLSHAFGAVFDNPDLLAIAVVGDGQAETAPLEGAWKGVSLLDPARDGAVLPILHLDGYRISGPTVLGRAGEESIRYLLGGHGYEAHFVGGDEPMRVHVDLAATLDACWNRIREIQTAARTRGVKKAVKWPAIVLRTPKGWTGPKIVDGLAVEGTFRAHRVPIADVRSNPRHLEMLEAWMRSYGPEHLFDERGRPAPDLGALVPAGHLRMGASTHLNAGVVSPLVRPEFAPYSLAVDAPGPRLPESTPRFGLLLREIFTLDAGQKNFQLFWPDETYSNRPGAVLEVDNHRLIEPTFDFDDHVARDGRVMEVRSEHDAQGWLEGYLLTGRHGIFATYEAFALVVASMATQHAKWLETSARLPWRKPVASLNYLLTSTCWRDDHHGFGHQGPGFMDTIISKKGTVARVYLPPDANCLLSVAAHCLRSRDHVNLIIIDKQPQLQWLDLAAAEAHCAVGASVWSWAGAERPDEELDVVLACAGDTATLETLAAAAWLRENAPRLSYRVVNVVDLMVLFSRREHPHGMRRARFVELFTDEAHVVFTFHGYPSAVHQILNARPESSRFHVRGFKKEETTTTPFDRVVVNQVSRFDICMDAIRRSRRPLEDAHELTERCEAMLVRHRAHVDQHSEDLPEIRDWTWSPAPPSKAG